MSKFIPGLVVCVLIALTVTTMFDKSSRKQGITQPVSSEVPVELTTTKSFAIDDGPTEEELWEQTVRRSEASARPGTDEPVVMQDQLPVEFPQYGSPELNDRQPSSEPELAASPDLSDYTPEIAEMLGLSFPKILRERHDSEERDDSWATYTEKQLHAYFAQRQALSQFYIAQIDCRTWSCEIHALGYGPDDRAIWKTVAWDIIDQPWHDLHRMFHHTVDVQPGITGNVLILGKDRY